MRTPSEVTAETRKVGSGVGVGEGALERGTVGHRYCGGGMGKMGWGSTRETHLRRDVGRKHRGRG